MDLGRFKIDLSELDEILEGRYEISTISLVIHELKSIKVKETKIALWLIELKNIKILKVEGTNVDDTLLKLAESSDVIVATNDRELRKRLKHIGAKTIYIRARKHLAIG